MQRIDRVCDNNATTLAIKLKLLLPYVVMVIAASSSAYRSNCCRNAKSLLMRRQGKHTGLPGSLFVRMGFTAPFTAKTFTAAKIDKVYHPSNAFLDYLVAFPRKFALQGIKQYLHDIEIRPTFLSHVNHVCCYNPSQAETCQPLSCLMARITSLKFAKLMKGRGV
uniref:Uncharacterized protein n=1 Tax=Glossina austeni TaxID=7395 RepID=A0A1A9UVG8_GLOAU